VHRRRRVAIVVTVAALVPIFAACQSTPTPPPDPNEARRVRADVEGGLNLYDAGDFVLAAHRFHAAAEGAERCGSLSMERRATQAECTSWLRARRLSELSECTARLETLHRKERRADPGLNTLLAMGAVAGGRPIPPFRVPAAVHPMVRAAAKE
jgi:hypothetical protein